MRFLYENHEDFQPLPSYYVVPGLKALMSSSIVPEALPHAEVNPVTILHGEQYLEIVSDQPLEGETRTELKVADALDKGSGALVIVDSKYARSSLEPL